MGKVVSVFNQKGGVGKTTTCINLSFSLASRKKKVLLIDMDPQGNSGSGLGIDKDLEGKNIYDVLIGSINIKDAIINTSNKNLDIIVSNNNLVGAEIELIQKSGWQEILKDKINSIKESYNFIFIDCPPSLGVLSLSSLIASDSILIPIQAEYYALEGVSQLFDTVRLVQTNFNEGLYVEGILISLYDKRTNLSQDVLKDVKLVFKDKVYDTIIPRNIKLAEAPSFGLSIFEHDRNSVGAKAYNSLGLEFLKKNKED